MNINSTYLEQCIIWLNLRLFNGLKEHCNNITSFLKEDSSNITAAEISIKFFSDLTELREKLDTMIPDRYLRYLHESLGLAIIEEDYIKAESIKNKINNI